ncbi:MAG: hypothetical protein QOE54_2181, partial [Streptosporangiaceae bacterium]|nr:hypothetical protein [Streptosporangiaceae bacterium]
MKNYLLVDVGQTGTRSRIVPRPSEQAADDL